MLGLFCVKNDKNDVSIIKIDVNKFSINRLIVAAIIATGKYDIDVYIYIYFFLLSKEFFIPHMH